MNSHQIFWVIRDESNSSLVWMGLKAFELLMGARPICWVHFRIQRPAIPCLLPRAFEKLQWFDAQRDLCFTPYRCHPVPAINHPPLMCHPLPSAWRWRQQRTLAFGAKSLVKVVDLEIYLTELIAGRVLPDWQHGPLFPWFVFCGWVSSFLLIVVARTQESVRLWYGWLNLVWTIESTFDWIQNVLFLVSWLPYNCFAKTGNWGKFVWSGPSREIYPQSNSKKSLSSSVPTEKCQVRARPATRSNLSPWYRRGRTLSTGTAVRSCLCSMGRKNSAPDKMSLIRLRLKRQPSESPKWNTNWIIFDSLKCFAINGTTMRVCRLFLAPADFCRFPLLGLQWGYL